MGLSVGLPRMHKEAGERRDFLPGFVSFLDRSGFGEIVLEPDYGSGMGFETGTYLKRSSRARVGTYEDCLTQDVVAVIRCPAEEALRTMRPGSILLSMLHYATRPQRTERIQSAGIRGISMDGIVDDAGHRLVENLQSVGWNGVRSAFHEIARVHPMFAHPSRRPIRVTCLGSGAVGGYAVHAAARYGDPKLREELIAKNVPGVEVTVVDFDLTWHEDYMLGRLEDTDLLIDATQRPDPTRFIVPNWWVAALPQDAVILDLSVDPYDFSVDPPRVKGIEGIPEGNLDLYVFLPDDPAYDRMDRRVRTEHRRVALSCYSWPGVHPRECMEIYGKQLEPVMRAILRTPVEKLDPHHGTHYERAVARAEVSRWMLAHAR
jgi:alanine dehydrogenase